MAWASPCPLKLYASPEVMAAVSAVCGACQQWRNHANHGNRERLGGEDNDGRRVADWHDRERDLAVLVRHGSCRSDKPGFR